MFKKLLSNLPFNPSLITQVSFYTQRMKQESAIRRTALVFMSLAMVVQFFAVISPPEPTLANPSDNDILRGGFSSRDDAAAKCRSNVDNFQIILEYYGISCDRLASTDPTVRKLTSTQFQAEGGFDSLGRTSVARNHPKTGKPSDQYTISIPNVGQPLYMKNLTYWDSGSSSTYNSIEVWNKDNVRMWLLMDCGNIVTIGEYRKPTPPVVIPDPKPPVVLPQVLSCSKLSILPSGSKIKLGEKITVRGQASGVRIKPGELVDMYYDFVDAKTNKVISSQKALGIGFNSGTANDPVSRTFSTNSPGQYLIKLTVKYEGSTKTASGSASGDCIKSISVQKSCPDSKNSQDLENCLDEHKLGYNTSQGAKKANEVTAKAGDTIQYNLSVTNTGNVTVPKSEYQMQENLSDVLDYADIVDLDGGTKGSNNIVTWPRVDIKAQQTVQKTIKVKLKSPVPGTPVAASDPGRFDCIMMNVFGVDSVSVKVDCPVIKTIETTNELPKTGPGTSLAIGFTVMALIGYFFARSRLFATELDIVRDEYAQVGGI